MSIDPRVRVGVDLGGTKTEAVVVRQPAHRSAGVDVGAAAATSQEDGATAPEVLTRSRIPTDREGGYEAIVAGTARLICDVAREAGLDALPPVGVGMPG